MQKQISQTFQHEEEKTGIVHLNIKQDGNKIKKKNNPKESKNSAEEKRLKCFTVKKQKANNPNKYRKK